MSWPLNFFWTVYLGLGAVCFVLEWLKPAHKSRYSKWSALPLDIVACIAYQFPIYGMAQRAGRVSGSVFADYNGFIYQIPLGARLAFAVIFQDFGSYWLHRMLHTSKWWNLHRFHHSPTELYWLAGVRATAPQQAIYNVPGIWTRQLFFGITPMMSMALTAWEVFHNHFQHVNFAWRSNWLEWFYVTPRYHHIHHSATHRGNYATKFTIWDRLFGTYVDPDTATPKKFGTGEDITVDPALMMVGLHRFRQPIEIGVFVLFYGFAFVLLWKAAFPSPWPYVFP